MAKKRAPGAGRKPHGEFKGKSATLTTRITPETRAALDRAAKEGRRSLSQEIEHRLDSSIRKDREHNRHRHVRGLAEVVAIVAHWVEQRTQKRWIDDPFTSEALRRAIEFLVFHFGAPGAPEIPARVKEEVVRLPPEARDEALTPSGVGRYEAGRLISWIEMNLNEGGRLSRRRIPGYHVPDEWYLYSQLFSELGSGWARWQKVTHKEGNR